MLTRSIDLYDPFDLSLGEKIFLNAKRLCIIFAGAALTLSALDLVNQHAAANGADHAYRVEVGALVHVVDAGIDAFSFVSTSPSVSIAIPSAVSVAEAAPVTELAAAPHRNTVAMAMLTPPVMPRPQAASPAQQSASRSERPASAPATIQLASLGPAAIPQPKPIAPVISLPSTISVLPMRPPPLSPAKRLHLQGASRAKAEKCLAKAVYFEARDQSFRGQVAVAQVIMNRVFSRFYPNDVCGVIYQNASHHLACQFTFACDGRSKAIKEPKAWTLARRIARDTLDGKLYVRAVGAATHYHAVYVHPSWVHEMHRIVREGIHTFYRPIAWGSGANLPIYSREELISSGGGK